MKCWSQAAQQPGGTAVAGDGHQLLGEREDAGVGRGGTPGLQTPQPLK